MILRRLQVKGWKCFGDAFSLGPFSEGITLVSGGNGTGKSSLFWALARGLFDRHGTGGKDLDRLRTWDRDLSPQVVVDFMVDGAEWRVEKTFLAGASSALYRMDGDTATLYAEADAADEHLRTLLGFQGTSRGLSQPKHWGLAQLLWAPQGAVAIPELGADTLGAIRQSLGGQLAAGSRIGAAVDEEYLRYYSPTGRELRGDRAPAVVALRAAREELRVRRTELDAQLLRFEELQQQLEDTRARGAQLAHEGAVELKNLEVAEERAQEYRALDAAVALEAKNAEVAEGRFRALDERIGQIAMRSARVAAAGEEAPLAEEAQEAARTARDVAAAAEAAARASLEAARTRSAGLQGLLARADAARELRDAHRVVADLTARLDEHRSRTTALEALRQERNALLAPTEKELREIRGLHAQVQEARVRLDATLITLEIEPDGELAGEVLLGEEVGPLEIAAGASRAVRGAPAVEVRIAGLGRIRARGPVGDAGAVRAALDGAMTVLAQRARAFGTTEPEELSRRAARGLRLDDAIDVGERALADLLGGESTDGLEQALATHRERIKAILADIPAWNEGPPDVEAEARRAQEVQAARMQELREAEAAMDLARASSGSAREDFERAAAALSGIAARREEDRDELERLRRADGLEDAARREQRDAAALEYRAATVQLKRSREQLAAFGEDPTAARDRLRLKVQEVRDALRERENQTTSLQVQLTAMAGSQSPQRELAVAEEKLAALDARILREERRMEAAALLRRLLQEEEQRRMDGLVAPVERDAGEILRRIAGPRLGALVVGDGLRPARMRPRAVREGIEPEIGDLSGGEREQVHFAVRLALAGVLARDRRQLVVLDDVLAYTDLARYNHVLGILDELSASLQIVILTCHPERYGSLADVRFDLESLRG